MIRVRVPATSANMGPGFDCMGIAVNLYNYFSFEEIDSGLEFEGCEEAFMNEDNLIYRSFIYTCDKLGLDRPKGLKITIDNKIPISRGLGSSATCIVGGILGASYLNDLPLEKAKILELATDIEGHPDNVAPAIYGGCSISIMDGKDIYYTDIETHESMALCALVPGFRLSTAEARAVLPESIDYSDAVYNGSRVALLVAALANGKFDLLSIACNDKLHQPYRGPLIKDYDKVIELCKSAGTKAVFISGAGPTIMNITLKGDSKVYESISSSISALEGDWSCYELEVDKIGAIVL